MIQANAFDIPLDDKYVHCAVTSPPYYSLRKYSGEQEYTFSDGWRGAYGLEPTLQMYIEHTVEWCREVWRVLRDDGTFWLNLGDSYAGSGQGGQSEEKKSKNWQPEYPKMNLSYRRDKEPVPRQMGYAAGLKPKNLMGVPWRCALALQADGWYLRSDIIWHKTNPMPESVTDRPTKSHEYLFLLTKSKQYYYDMDAIREGVTGNTHSRGTKLSPPKEAAGTAAGFGHEDWTARTPDIVTSRNKRTVWTIATAPYSGAHFATYPPALVEPCIKAGTSEHGVCPECGNPWERVIGKGKSTMNIRVRDAKRGVATAEEGYSATKEEIDHYGKEIVGGRTTLGWLPTCSHDLDPIPATVLDPFSGSGTTLLVARKLGRRAIGLDISAEYLDLAKERLSIKALEEWENGKAVSELDYEGLTLFEGLSK